MRSPDQRSAAEAEQRRAEAIAAAERYAARQVAAEVGAGGVAVRSAGDGGADPRPFRVRWAAQIAAGRAEVAVQRGRTGAVAE